MISLKTIESLVEAMVLKQSQDIMAITVVTRPGSIHMTTGVETCKMSIYTEKHGFLVSVCISITEDCDGFDYNDVLIIIINPLGPFSNICKNARIIKNKYNEKIFSDMIKKNILDVATVEFDKQVLESK